jgi:mono/diheme cytochrome c family protein
MLARAAHLSLTFALFLSVAACGHKVGPASSLQVDKTPERTERGRYLATHVAACMDCHAKRDWSLFSAPPLPGTAGGGGERFSREHGFPGEFYSSNISAFALSSWSDGEIERAITAGVSKDGRALFPLMPYLSYGKLCQDDVDALIAYLRSLPPIEATPQAPDFDFPFSLILRGIPKVQPRPQCKTPAETTAYGEYVATAASCMTCHSQETRGEPVAGLQWGGGREFQIPGGTVRSSNITPDVETGIGGWTKETFIARFKAHAAGEPVPVTEGDLQTVMPWRMYAGMSETDLGALFVYLRTLKPVRNPVERWSPQPGAPAHNAPH